MILNKSVAPTEGEISVKTYLCTSFNSFLFGLKANGYLEVTSKRLLFQAMGSGVTRNPSVLHSEVPLSEVVGVNIYKGKAFNLGRLITGILIAVLAIAVAGMIFTFLLSWMEKSRGFYQFVIWALFMGAVYLAYFFGHRPGIDDEQLGLDAKDTSLQELLIICAGLGALVCLAKGISGYNAYGSAVLTLPVAAVTIIYALYRYSKKSAFSLLIHSKSGSNAIVRVTGPSPLGAANSTAAKALTAKPARDSLLVLKELGAVISDIQNLGDFGIEKWRITKSVTAIER